MHIIAATNHGTVLVLQEESKKEAGLGEDAATFVCHFIPCPFPISLQQVKQRFYRVFHCIHGLNGLVVLREETKREGVEEQNIGKRQDGTNMGHLKSINHLFKQRGGEQV